MTIRAAKMAQELRQVFAKRRLFLLARVVFIMCVLGNLNFQLSRAICRVVLSDAQFLAHAVVFGNCIRACLDACLIGVIFRRSLFNQLKWRGSQILFASLLALSIVGVQIVATLQFPASISSFHLAAIQYFYILAFSLSAAVSEELLCRFVLLGEGAKIGGPIVALLFQTFLFTYIHIASISSGATSLSLIAAGGMLIGSVYLLTNSLLCVIVLHFAYDIFIIIVFGGILDGMQVFPMLVGDNFGRHASINAAVIFQSTLGALIVLTHFLLQRSRSTRLAARWCQAAAKTKVSSS